MKGCVGLQRRVTMKKEEKRQEEKIWGSLFKIPHKREKKIFACVVVKQPTCLEG